MSDNSPSLPFTALHYPRMRSLADHLRARLVTSSRLPDHLKPLLLTVAALHTAVQRCKYCSLCASTSRIVSLFALLQVDDNWAECDACKKWRRLPGTFIVADGAHFQCSDADRSCEEPEGPVLPECTICTWWLRGRPAGWVDSAEMRALPKLLML